MKGCEYYLNVRGGVKGCVLIWILCCDNHDVGWERTEWKGKFYCFVVEGQLCL